MRATATPPRLRRPKHLPHLLPKSRVSLKTLTNSDIHSDASSATMPLRYFQLISNFISLVSFQKNGSIVVD